ncbi:DUF2303 family protein [Caviibacterium pharyngocola]|uniref:DUF2303 domain-containing protein n=1 Tax=Caviibacterium pharyngocola TaxID=28159 RepID=A0A2M8RUM4_9PAST|nr:DUF2303 family protein [Caviibacterium pharyngocola]PJG82596.1 hypothetical protein CVP04_08230 [Caviibacterium pharyngocola]
MSTNQIQDIVKLGLSSVRVDSTEHPIAILPENMTIHNLEEFNDKRAYFRARFETTSFNALVEYAKADTQEDAQAFIDERRMTAEIVFDMGNVQSPKHARHRAKLDMVKTAAFKALCEFEGVKHSQKNFAEWLEDWADYISANDENGNEMPLNKAIQAVRKITLDYARNEEHEVGDFAATKSALERVEAKSKLELPASFTFTCDPYTGLSIRDMHLRLSILTGGNEPLLIVRIVKGEQLKESIANEFADKLRDAISDTDIKVNIGSISI